MSELKLIENIRTLDDGFISIDFSLSEGLNTFRDAIVLPLSIYKAWTRDDIDAEQMRRWSEWIAFINLPEPDNVEVIATPQEFTDIDGDIFAPSEG